MTFRFLNKIRSINRTQHFKNQYDVKTKINDSPNGILEMTDENDVAASLIDTIQDSDLKSIGMDYGEIALDALTDSELLKQIPVLGTLQKAYGIAGNISNHLFAKKLLRFLNEFSDISAKDRREMISKLVVNTEERQRIGETLMLILDKLNDMKKPTLLARAFRAFLENKIALEDFVDLAQSIDMVRVTHLPTLKLIYKGGFIPPTKEGNPRNQEIKQHFVMCGLMSMSVSSKETPRHGVPKSNSPRDKQTTLVFERTFLGILFADHVLGN